MGGLKAPLLTANHKEYLQVPIRVHPVSSSYIEGSEAMLSTSLVYYRLAWSGYTLVEALASN